MVSAQKIPAREKKPTALLLATEQKSILHRRWNGNLYKHSLFRVSKNIPEKTMGRIKTKPIKSAGDAIYEKHGEKVSKSFEKNKELLPEFAEVRSKKIRNILAGYLVKKAKQNS